MLPLDFSLPLLLGVDPGALVRKKRFPLGRSPKTAGLGGGVASFDSREAALGFFDSRPAALFVDANRYRDFVLPHDTPSIRPPARLRATRIPIDAPDGLALSVGDKWLYVPIAQLMWSGGTPPVLVKGELMRVGLHERCVMRLRGRLLRWVLDVRGPDAVLYEDRSAVAPPHLGRPPVEHWLESAPLPGWLVELVVAAANRGDVLAPLVAVGLLVQYVGNTGFSTPSKRPRTRSSAAATPPGLAVPWRADAGGEDDLDMLADSAVGRALDLSKRLAVLTPDATAEAVAICCEREFLSAIALALRTRQKRPALDAALARVDRVADESLATLDAARADARDMPEVLARAPAGWWVSRA